MYHVPTSSLLTGDLMQEAIILELDMKFIDMALALVVHLHLELWQC